MDVVFWKVDVQDSIILLNFPFLYYARKISSLSLQIFEKLQLTEGVFENLYL